MKKTAPHLAGLPKIRLPSRKIDRQEGGARERMLFGVEARFSKAGSIVCT
jgi:hypothetical protein